MISIIIPIYNEEENLLQYNDDFFPYTEKISSNYNIPFEYVFVDDGSSDSSVELLKEIAKKRSDCTILFHKTNKGMGGAIKTGISGSSGDLIVTIDSDLTYRPEDIKKLIDAYRITQADCISGSPYVEDNLIENVPLSKKVPSIVLNLMYRFLLQQKITCVSAVFRLYKKDALENISIESNDFSINAEILVKFLFSGKKICEIPAVLHSREYGISKLDTRKEIINNLRLLSKILKIKIFGSTWN